VGKRVVLIALSAAVSLQLGPAGYGAEKPPSIHQIELEKHRAVEPVYPEAQYVAPLAPRKRAAPDREVFGYHPYWMGTAYMSYHWDLLTTVAYFGVEVNGTGDIVNRHRWPVTDLVNRAHQNGVRVVLVAILFSRSELDLLLASSRYRTRLVQHLLDEVIRGHADGINIDFEGVPGTQRNNLVAFMRELAETFHSHLPGSYVTMATPAVNWSNAFDYQRLAEVTDGLFIMGYDYHWKGSSYAGPVSPLAGWGTYNITWTVNDYLSATGGDGSKIILGLPYYGYKWPTTSGIPGSATRGDGKSIRYSAAEPEAQSYGKIRDPESLCPWYRWQESDGWHQCWYDDSTSLSAKYELAIEKDLKGVGMWALGYDGSRTELRGALADHFGSNAPPLEPTHFRVIAQNGGKIKIACRAPAGATAYRLYHSLDGKEFEVLADFPSVDIELTRLEPRRIHYFQLSALNGNGESPKTEVLAAVPDSVAPRVLIVNGFDRMSEGGNTRDFVIQHGGSMWRAGVGFSSASNEAVQDGDVSLAAYDVVDWILGEEGTADETFSDREQRVVADFMESGGMLFVTGSEIGWDLEAKGSANDTAFYHTYLKARYVKDKVADWTVEGVAGSIFEGLAFAYDDGTHGIYSVSYPDGIEPVGGSRACLRYNADYVAGVQYEGTFGDGQTPGKLVYLGIPFETIYPQAARDSVMARVLAFFGAVPTGLEAPSSSTVPEQFALSPAFPNPFNSSTTLELKVPRKTYVGITVRDVLGRKVRTLMPPGTILGPGRFRVRWDGRDDAGRSVPSGTYLLVVRSREQVLTRRVTLLR